MTDDITEVRLEAIVKEVKLIQHGAVLRVGQLLTEAQGIFLYRRDEGGFRGWVAKRLGIGHSTAYRLIGVYQRFGAESVPAMDTLPATVLYELAQPSTPDAVRQAVVEKAVAGEKVTSADIKDLKAKLADKDDKLRTLKTQKQSADAHNSRLIDDIRSKTNECERLAAWVSSLREELRRRSEPDVVMLEAAETLPTLAPLLGAWDAASDEKRKEFMTDKRIAVRACEAKVFAIISAFIDETPKEQWIDLIEAARWQVNALETWVRKQLADEEAPNGSAQ